MEWQVSLNNNSFDRAGITKDCKDAICEYIWNGFEAGADKIIVSQKGSPLYEAMSIEVLDNGSGIQYNNLKFTFGTFLSSIKNNSNIRIKSQTNKGKGRFSYLCFSSSAEWHTTYQQEGELKGYMIKTDSSNRNHFTTTEPNIEDAYERTGTSVEFPISDPYIIDQLSYVNMRQKLLEEFAWFLYLNKSKKLSLEYMGNELDISHYINTDLSTTKDEQIENNNFKINVIVWRKNVANSSKTYYLNTKGEVVSTYNTSFNKNTVGFFHAVFVISEYFKPGMFFPLENESDQLESNNAQLEIEPQNEYKAILRQLKNKIASMLSDALKTFLVLKADKHLTDLEKRGSFPTFNDDEYGQLRKKDFQVVTRELYCVEPRIFHKLNSAQEKSLLGFLNLLLSSEERENVLQIVDQVVNLTPEQRKNFAIVLQRTKLQYIVEAISIIEKRITIVEELKRIVFDMSLFANERDHIQKIIEQHFWLFGEQYHLLTADKNLRTSLFEFEKVTEVHTSYDTVAITSREALQRFDIFLYTQRIQEDSSSEMLIVELKAPYVNLSLDVYNQVVRYANTIRKEPRFNGTNRKWRFFAVCANVEDEVKTKYVNFEQYGKKGLVDVIGNFEIYALSWDDIFQAFESRHSFLLDKLKLDYSQISSVSQSNDNNSLSRETVTKLTNKLVSINVN